ncbi:MFS transporter [Haladaptatus caseinilyticus]|uniref:MFS transporter n=1 Tax=Haladaptatus caseinilyticus TaxID=2993314 RepID=UPI00224A6D1F|nr:MFS transporter [Haladaptatus caseinilyticus]
MSTTARRARFTDTLVFGILGVLFGTWAVRIPAISATLDLSSGDIAVALVGLACGSLVGLPLSGILVSRFGSRNVIRAGLCIYCLSLPLVALSSGLAMLVGLLFLFGFGKGLIDVAANTQGVRIETAYSGQIMGSIHAMFSGGGLVGSGLGAVATDIGLSVESHFAIVSVTSLTIGLLTSRWLLPTDGPIGATTGTGRTFALPSRKLAGFCVIGFSALFIEGVVNDWSAVFLEDYTGASASIAALGFAAFSLMMMVGRFSADHVVELVGSHRFIRIAAGVAAIGVALTLIAQTALSIVGFGLLGIGLAGIMPVTFSLAANADPETPTESAVAAVSTAGYGGFAVGPVAIGSIAEATTLRLAFVSAFALTILIALLTVVPTVSNTTYGDESTAQVSD